MKGVVSLFLHPCFGSFGTVWPFHAYNCCIIKVLYSCEPIMISVKEQHYKFYRQNCYIIWGLNIFTEKIVQAQCKNRWKKILCLAGASTARGTVKYGYQNRQKPVNFHENQRNQPGSILEKWVKTWFDRSKPKKWSKPKKTHGTRPC